MEVTRGVWALVVLAVLASAQDKKQKPKTAGEIEISDPETMMV